jgi:hypothetical protein
MQKLSDVVFADAYARSAVQGIERDLKRFVCLGLSDRSIHALLTSISGILELAEVAPLPGCVVDPGEEDAD